MRITEITEEDRITAALEHATEAIRVLRKKLDIATEALKKYAHGSDIEWSDWHDECHEVLDRIENEQ